MAKHRKRRPHDPAKAEAEREARRQRQAWDAKARNMDPARWGEERASRERLEALERQGADVTLDAGGRIKNARKADVWAQMHARNNLTDKQHSAIRTLETDMIVRSGYGLAGETNERIDRQGDAAAVTDRMVEAGARVDDALALVGPPASRILQALVGPDASDGDWRLVVERIARETNAMAQGAVLRQAAQSLADVYAEVEARAAARLRARKDRLDAAGNGHRRANAA